MTLCRPYVLFFTGSIREANNGYSGGARQTFARLMEKRPELASKVLFNRPKEQVQAK